MHSHPYHFELNEIVEDVHDSFSRYQVSSKQYELEIKLAFLKNCKNQAEFKSLQSKSQLRPVIINDLKNSRNFRINALCENDLYKNAMQNLRQLSLRSQITTVEQTLICYKSDEDKYTYECGKKKWEKTDKDRLFHKQYDVISNKKLFRIDCSLKIQKNITHLAIRNILQKYKRNSGFLRFKHSFVYHLHDFFHIEASCIFETEEEKEVLLLNGWVDKAEDIDQEVAKKMMEEEGRSNIKHQIELKFTQKGIDFLRQCAQNERKEEISRAFNTIRDITNISKDQSQLAKLMSGLSLEQSKQKQQEPSLEFARRQEKAQRSMENKGEQEKEERERGKQVEEEELVFIVRRK